jgi:hypothetical protein
MLTPQKRRWENSGIKGVNPMKTKLLAIVAVVAAVLVFSGPMLAHHGTAAYDTSNPLTLKGAVTDFKFINPHCQVYFDIKNDKGEVEHWQGELTAPNKLARAGWTKHSLNPGDKITVTGFVGKYGGHSLWIRKLIGPDGQSMQLFED